MRTTTLKKAENAPSTPDISELEAADRVLELVRESLEDSKAEDIVSVNIRGKSAMADYMVIASGRSHRHVGAVADHLLRALKEAGYGTAKVEGLSAADWVLIDAGDVIVHVFRPEVRDFYALEKIWQEPEETHGTLH